MRVTMFIRENNSRGMGASISAMRGASIVVNRAAILQYPKTLDAYCIGKYSAVTMKQRF
jgi:hypothetical protein